MSPERAATGAVDHRTDIYGLGVLAYEVLTGRLPRTEVSSRDTPTPHVSQSPEPVTTHRPTVPPALAALVMHCLEEAERWPQPDPGRSRWSAPAPSDRWQSVDEVFLRLEELYRPSGSLPPFPFTHTTPSPVEGTTRSRRTARYAIVGVTTLAALAAATAVFIPRRAALVPERLFIRPFTNETADSSLESIGKVVADWLARSLQESGLVEVIDPRMAVFSLQPDAPAPNAKPGDLAREMGAGTTITGRYYRQGDSIRFHAQVTETESGRLLDAVGPVGSLATNPLEGAEQIQQRVMASLAARFSPELAGFAENMRPPTSYAVYREYVAGRDLFVRGDPGAMRHLRRALAMDPTFVPAVLYAAIQLRLADRHALSDSMVASLGSARANLTNTERFLLDWLEAGVHWDLDEMALAARRARESAPTSPELAIIAGRFALYAGRAREAVELLSPLEPRLPEFNCCRVVISYLGDLGGALHVLREHEEEVRVARRVRRQFPELLQLLVNETEALAALGRVDEIERLLDESLTYPTGSGPPPAVVAHLTAHELLAHGYRDDAHRIFLRGLAWMERLAPAQAGQPGNEALLGELLADVNQLDEARDVFERLVDEAPSNSNYLLYVGLIAAKQGRHEEARKIRDRLADMEAPHLHWRADLAAMLGEKDEAVQYLREAMSRGATYGPWLHRDWFLQPVLDYPAFQTLISPKR